MPQFTPDAQRMITDLASRYRVSADAVLTLLEALQEGGGRQAQFSHVELGGMGQWSHGGMIMVGDMFNSALKARVDGLCSELAAWLGQMQRPSVAPFSSQQQSQHLPGTSDFAMREGATWWPVELGRPTSVGAQNDLRYAYFSATRRLAVNDKGRISIYGTGNHQISGIAQQQGLDQSITLTSSRGPVRLTELSLIASEAEERRPNPSGAEPGESREEVVPASVGAVSLPSRLDHAKTSEDDIFAKIERLAELRSKGILTEEEFTAKKAELLSRL